MTISVRQLFDISRLAVCINAFHALFKGRPNTNEVADGAVVVVVAAAAV